MACINLINLNDAKHRQELDLVLHATCRFHGLNFADFLSCTTDPTTGDVTFTFNGLRLPPKFGPSLEVIRRQLRDPFRQQVIRAAVPEFSAATERIMMLLEQMHNPYTIRVAGSEVKDILKGY